MAKNAKLYFEHHAHDYSDRHVQFYSKIGDYIRNAIVSTEGKEGVSYVSNNKQTIMLLDVGCGNGSFVKYFIDTQEKKTPHVGNNDYYFVATDLSFEMIKLAKQNLSASTN